MAYRLTVHLGAGAPLVLNVDDQGYVVIAGGLPETALPELNSLVVHSHAVLDVLRAASWTSAEVEDLPAGP